MRVWNHIPTLNTPMVISIGKFDGLHIGHQLLIDTIESLCSSYGYDSMVLKFQNNPQGVLRGQLPGSIMSLDIFEHSLARGNINHLVELDFTDLIAQIKPSEFIKIITERINVKHIIVGMDFRYGYKAEGNVETLKQEGKDNGFDVSVIPPTLYDSTPISSSRIRNLLSAGELTTAYKMMHTAYTIKGKVIKGRQYGRKIGFPTANIEFDEKFMLLPNGVYITMAKIDDLLWPAVTNVGHNPTVVRDGIKTIETHVMGLDTDLYNKTVKICFMEKLRDELMFENVRALREQIEMDVSVALVMHIDKKDIYNKLCL